MKKWKKLTAALLSGMLLFGSGMSAFAEEYDTYEESYESSDDSSGDTYEEEEEFIPEDYYDPIETNEIAGWPQGPMIQAASAIVMDLDTNAVMYGKNLDEVHYPASITKIMTTLIALENCSLDEVITCGPEVYDLEENSSNLGIQDGEELTMRQALYGLMLASANDIANAIAVYVGGSMSGFADMMNAKAEELGCTHTHFANPSGLNDENHYTTVRDMALIAQAAYANPQFREIASTTEYTIPETNVTEETRSFLNHHKILQSDSEYFQSWCTGGKTGYTSDAWNTLVTFAEADGRRLVCVLLRENGAARAYTETTDLMGYAFENFYNVTLGEDEEIPDFYELLKLNYPNAGTTYIETDALKQKVMTIVKKPVVTVPSEASVSDLGVDIDASTGTTSYSWNGYPMGEGIVTFTALPENITLSYQQERDMTAILTAGEEIRRQNELTQTAELAISNLQSGSTKAYQTIRRYIKENTMTVILIGVFVLAILLIMIIILIMRTTKESRIRRKRRAEERARMRAEEAIDRMSAVEIEQELREAMESQRKQDEADKGGRHSEAEDRYR